MKKAWVENNIIRDIAPGNPLEFYHADIAAFYVTDVPDSVINGASLVNGEWVNPILPEPGPTPAPAPTYPKVGPIHFQMLFAPEEAVVANDLKATDKALAAFWKLIDDPRTDVVDLGLTSVQNAVEYTLTVVSAAIVAAGGSAIDVPARKAAILSGVLQ